jgi:hypothetical protein
MPSMLSSDPPSQYCIDRNQARMSWALPGMKRRIFGRRRSIAICFSPEEPEGDLLPRSFFRKAIAPDAGSDMSRSPILVSLTICGSEMMPTQASSWSRRAWMSGRIWVRCSSRKIRFATMMLARDVGLGAGEGSGVFGPFGGGVDRDGDAGEVLCQSAGDALGGACGMGVEGDDDEAVEVRRRAVFRSGDV